MTSRARVGIVGLGIMGSAYARHVLAAGFPTIGYDIVPDALRRFTALGGSAASSPRALAERVDVLLTSLPSTAALESAYFGTDGIVPGVRSGLVVLETSTFALREKERVRAALEARGARALDVPVSGTGAQAQQRDLVLFASGERAAYDGALPVMQAYARDVRYVGPYGSGSKLKYIANLLVTIHNLSTAEAVVLAEQAGIDPAVMIDVLGESAAGSRMLQVRGPLMAERRYEPPTMKVGVHRKDISIIADFAAAVGAPTPLFSQSALFYAAADARGHTDHDTAALADVLRCLAGRGDD
jgi:3-hydroxyisobutyrate dehydrogenase-like beta-hydroxyacid dehydrogenase